MRKYNKNIKPYIQNGTVGFAVRLAASIVCCPTFSRSGTPMRATIGVVLMIRLSKFTPAGTRRRVASGITT